MKILVTGATGFLGKHLCFALENRGWTVFKVSTLNCNLLDSYALDCYKDEKFDAIYHLAAWTQAGNFSLHHPAEQWVINQKIHTNVLSFWIEKMPDAKLITIGTSCAYDPRLPLKEEYYLEGKPIECLFSYAMTKRMLLAGLQSAHKQYGLSYLHVVPSTLYGPGYHTRGKQLHFIFDLIKKILSGLYLKTPVILWGDGLQKRELIHVDDFISAMMALVEKNVTGTVNIGYGKEETILRFAELICQQVGYPLKDIQFDSSQYVGARSKILSIEKLKSLIPAFEPRSIEEGLFETIEWYREALFGKEQTQKRDASTHKYEKVPG